MNKRLNFQNSTKRHIVNISDPDSIRCQSIVVAGLQMAFLEEGTARADSELAFPEEDNQQVLDKIVVVVVAHYTLAEVDQNMEAVVEECIDHVAVKDKELLPH